MNVDTLEGAELDYWVARAEERNPKIMFGKCIVILPIDHLIGPDFVQFNPTDQWVYMGPILERKQGTFQIMFDAGGKQQHVTCSMGFGVKRYTANGPTHLIAAARAFVGSIYGSFIPEVPKEDIR